MFCSKKDFEYFLIPVADFDSVNISQYFEEAYEFIEKGLTLGNVLIVWSIFKKRSWDIKEFDHYY